MGGNTDVVAPESPVIDQENPTGAGGADQALGGADGADGSLEARDSFDDDVLSVNLDATIGDGFGF